MLGPQHSDTLQPRCEAANTNFFQHTVRAESEGNIITTAQSNAKNFELLKHRHHNQQQGFRSGVL